MKKIINNAQNIVAELCHGMVLAHPDLAWDQNYNFLYRKNLNSDKVCLISGGGSGHEPAHGGFVGCGMLDSAVCGDMFASPSQIQIYQAIRKVANPHGVLLVIKNYSGDVMNFKNAAALAQEDGIPVDYVVVDDDIAVQNSLYTVGRRGVAGTLFVHKIAGAAAERGYALAQTKAVAEKVISATRSIGFSLTSCTVPAKGTPTFSIEEDEMEYGVGIHGEPGIRREKISSADELANRMVQSLLQELDCSSGQEVALMINGLGGTPLQELYVLNQSVRRELDSQHVSVSFCMVGNYMTSIDMAGASVTLLKLDPEIKELLCDACHTPALKISGGAMAAPYFNRETADSSPQAVSYDVETDAIHALLTDNQFSLGNLIYLVDSMSACIIQNEVPFCELDSYAGDGDFGMSVAKGFRRLKENWSGILRRSMDIGAFLSECSLIIMESCGGASGPIWGSAFRAAGKYAAGKQTLSAEEFAAMLQCAVTGIQKTGERSFGRGAVVGDKTLMDALIPCADVWSELAGKKTLSEIMKAAAAAAVAGAESTKSITARMGRAGTVGKRSLGHPDAGAYALGAIFTELAEKTQISL